MNEKPRIKAVLSLPRAGTHFIWSRCVASGDYQLIYDADRIPALVILAEEYNKKLGFLNPRSLSQNYGFRYNSLSEVTGTLSPSEHLDFLKEKYGTKDDFDLFCRILEQQDCPGRTLLMVNRFVYTVHYNYLFDGFAWTTDHAIRALKLLHNWFEKAGYPVSYSMVIRPNPEWLRSTLMLLGEKYADRIEIYLKESAKVLEACDELGISIFWMNDVIEQLNAGVFDYERCLPPVETKDWQAYWADIRPYMELLHTFKQGRKFLRWGRFMTYVKEKDPIKRTSLVRSIGSVPLSVAHRFPFGLGRTILEDVSSVSLDNARLKNIKG